MIFSTSCEHPRVKEPDGYKRANLIIQAFELVAKQPDETKVTLIHSIDFGWIQDKFVQVDIKRCGQRLENLQQLISPSTKVSQPKPSQAMGTFAHQVVETIQVQPNQQSTPKFCSECGNNRAPTTKFCPECGHKFT